MGQRLVIEFIYNEDCVMALYQHWNGYTIGAITTVANILQRISDPESRRSRRALAHAVYETLDSDTNALSVRLFAEAMDENADIHPGIDIEDWNIDVIRNEIDLPPASNRNIGMLAFSDDTMTDMIRIADNLVFIDLGTLTADISGEFCMTSPEQGSHPIPLPYPVCYDDWKNSDFRFGLPELKEIIGLLDEESHVFVTDSGTYVTVIE